MVRRRQRKKQLAAAKLDRQTQKRTAAQARNRTVWIAVGVVVALIAAAALIWLILHLVNEENDRVNDETPTSTTPSSDVTAPTQTTPTTGATSSAPSSGGTKTTGSSPSKASSSTGGKGQHSTAGASTGSNKDH